MWAEILPQGEADGGTASMRSAGPVADLPPLRILTYLNSLAPGGVERVALRLHHAWRGAGADARLLIADGTDGPAIPRGDVRVLGSYRTRTGRFVALFAALCRTTRDERPDVLFCAGNTYSLLAVCLKLWLGRRCPVIVAKVSNDLVRADLSAGQAWWYRRWLQLQGRCIDRFVGMAPAMRREIRDRVGVPDRRIAIVEDPALTDRERLRFGAMRKARSGRRRPEGRAFVAVGRLVPQKNFALLIDAFARIAAPDDTLAILGEGVLRATLETQIARLGLGERVALPGHVDPLDAWLADSDAFVLSSDYEGVPAALIEALAAGMPIVATDCCISMPDLIGHGRLGRLVPVGDVLALSDAMAEAVASPGHADERRADVTRFTIEAATGRYLEVLNEACGRAPRR